jgi:ubiquinone/menaquinone biosynthesis C-methylase UbiE
MTPMESIETRFPVPDPAKLPQSMLPHGFGGRVFGWIMETVAASNYRWVVDQVAPFKPRTYLEIGLGTGKLAEMVAREIKPSVLCAVDPSELMFAKASKRLRRLATTSEVDLRLGNDTALPWADHSFDAIVASHSFQFWSDPGATLKNLRALIAPQGHLVFVLRNHRDISKSVPSWIPNPVTKSGQEIAGLKQALADSGFRVIKEERLRSGSDGLIAACA